MDIEGIGVYSEGCMVESQNEYKGLTCHKSGMLALWGRS